MRSAIAGGQTTSLDYETMTGKISPIWHRFPEGRHFGTVLEIGAGYGRIPLYLARERRVTWSTYCAVDISAAMLQRFIEYRDRSRPHRRAASTRSAPPPTRSRSRTTASTSRSRAPSSCTWARASSAARSRRSRAR